MSDNETKNPANSVNSSILDKIMGSQTQSGINEFQPSELVSSVLGLLKERDREILSKRFGLDGLELETLEGIGKKYTLTRERVRQIEKDSLNYLKKSALDAKKIPELEKSDVKELQAVKFLLNLGEQFKNLKETAEYYESWYLVGFDLARLQQVISEFMSILEEAGHVISQDELMAQFKQTQFYRANQIELGDKVLKSYLNIAKTIQINPFNEIGLKNWNEVKPRDVGDKAYLVLKHHGKPEHYSVITKMINDNKFDTRVAFQETVHNELIKDSRFVLIGRGIYALSEWGYKKGVVADVIKEILKAFNRPLTREEIIHEVMKKRQVKRNTILVGLSNRKNFQKVSKDKYILAAPTETPLQP